MSTTKKENRGRPKKDYRTKNEKNEAQKLRSRVYYSSPEVKEQQRIRMMIYHQKNKDMINEKRCKKRRLKKFEKNLKLIWISRGLL